MLKEDERKYILHTYNRKPKTTPLLVKGKGTLVWDEEGKEYLDFVGGLAVNGLGHAFQPAIDAAWRQMQKIIHTSNLFYTEPQIRLARLLVENSAGDKVFFCNSGAEANEAAIKLARKYAKTHLSPEKYEIITAYNSFHGRTMATLTATGQDKFHKGFEPLLPGFLYAEFNNLDSFLARVSEYTCAIMVEPVQGEGGVHVASREFLQGLRQLCDEKGLLLIFDEVQSGMGRTGRLFAYECYGVAPDIFTLAKSLGGGLPIGAMLCTDRVAAGFAPGDHASTFGGNPVACAAAEAVLNAMLGEGFLEEVAEKGLYFKQELKRLQEKHPSLVREVRGLGLIVGMELAQKGRLAQEICLKKGLLVNCIGDTVLRFLPPLNVKKEEINRAVEILGEALAEL